MVFKVRNKLTGKFINKSGGYNKDGSVFQSLSAANGKRNSRNTVLNKETGNFEDNGTYETVTFDLVEVGGKEQKLLKLCQEYIKEHEISCPEAICQRDCIIENAYNLIEQICDIVGYHKYSEDE